MASISSVPSAIRTTAVLLMACPPAASCDDDRSGVGPEGSGGARGAQGHGGGGPDRIRSHAPPVLRSLCLFWQRVRDRLTHDPRRVPPPRAPGRGLHRGLLAGCRKTARAVPAAAGRDRGEDAPRRARKG